MSAHRLLLASAGSGKTYQLASHYLGLLLRGAAPRQILATTFTRKAAGEILGRVLQRLAQAATDPEETAKLAEDAGVPGLTPERCRDRLAELARGLQQFRVQTLDSWFAHVARLFAVELGLPPDWRIADASESARVRSEALIDALASDDEGRDEESEWLVLLRALARTEGDLFVHQALLDHVETGANIVEGVPDEAWDSITVMQAPDPEALEDAVDQLAQLELPLTKAGSPNKTWQKAQLRVRDLVDAGEWRGFLKDSFVDRAVEGEDFSRAPMPLDWQEVFQVLAQNAAHHVSQEVVEHNHALRDLLQRFREAHVRHRDEARALEFDDVARALADGQRLGPLELAFRLDARLDHLMLDEFQDTAPVQWTVLDPLVESLIHDTSGERTFFCVGDEKQSIYAFRGGEPRLLGGLPRKLDIEPEKHNTSWRSSAVVLDTVNRVFSGIAGLPVMDEEDHLRAGAEEFQGRFGTHKANRELPGDAALWIAPDPGDAATGSDDEDQQDVGVLDLAADRVAALRAEAPHATIGVLLRTNKELTSFVRILEGRGIPVSGEGGAPLTDTPAVLAVLALLHWIDHPSDTAAAYHLATSPLGEALGLGLETATGDAGLREALAAGLRRRLAEEGAGALLSSLAGVFAEHGDARDVMRFQQVVDLAHAQVGVAHVRATELARRIREARQEEARPGAVRVMTVHASKGLEFDAVVLPQLGDLLMRHSPSLLVDRPDPVGAVQAVSTGLPKELLKHLPEVAELDQTTRKREAVDALCVLYVALTRAAHRIDLVLPHKFYDRSYATILKQSLGAGDGDEQHLAWRHPDGADAWWPEPEDEAPAPPPRPEPALVLGAGDGAHRPPRRTPSGQEGPRERRAVDVLRRAGGAGRRRGTLVHRLLEEVLWLEDFTATDDELRPLLTAAAPEADEAARDEALAFFRAALARPAVQELLSLGDRDREATVVHNERPFQEILVGPEGPESWVGVMDRVVVRRRDGRPVSAEIIDHKTDDTSRGTEALVAHYAPQLESYRAVLAHQLQLDPDRIRARLLFLASGEVVDVEPA